MFDFYLLFEIAIQNNPELFYELQVIKSTNPSSLFVP